MPNYGPVIFWYKGMLTLKRQLAHYLQKIAQHQAKTISEIMHQQERATVPAHQSRDEARMYLELLDLLKPKAQPKKDVGQAEDPQLDHLLHELAQDTLHDEEEESSGRKGLNFYEGLLKDLKPEKAIPEFEIMATKHKGKK